MSAPLSLNQFVLKEDPLSAYIGQFHFEISLFGYWYQGEIRQLRNLLLNDIKIAFTTQGSCRIATVEQEYVANPGDVFILPPYTLHHADFITDGPVESFDIHMRILPPHLQQWFVENLHGRIFFPRIVTPALYERLTSAYRLTCEKAPGSYLLIRNILTELLALCLNYSAGQHPVSSRRLGSREKVAADFLSCVDSHYRENLRIEDICRLLHVSPSYLSRCLAEVLGVRATSYIMQYKLLRAQDLLKTGSMSIQETADYLGFSSVSYFSRLFRQHFNEAPSHFARRYEETSPEPVPKSQSNAGNASQSTTR